MGDSDKLTPSGPDRYTLRRAPALSSTRRSRRSASRRDVTLVIHDWGSALGFDWANRHRDAVQGIAYMEAIVRPITWDEWPRRLRAGVPGISLPRRRGHGAGEERLRRARAARARSCASSTDEEMAVYRRPFAEPGEGRRPTLTWPRQIPIGGEPADVVAIVQSYARLAAQERPCRSCSSTPTPAPS